MKIIPYLGNPLKEPDGTPAHCGFRCIIFHRGLYYEYDEGYYDGKWQIFLRTSKDGIVFSSKSEPLFSAGEPGEYDEKGQADPTIVYEDDLWKMWFDAFDGTLYWDKIGYATSINGLNWIKQKSVLSRGNEGEWDSKAIHHPVVLKYDKYYMYYSGCADGLYPVKNIGLAISYDGINWIKEKEPVLTIGDSWDSIYIRPSCPIFLYGRWNMFYWGFNGQHSMGLAESSDLIHWEKKGHLLSGTDEHDGITASMPINDENGLRIYYATFDDIRIRMALIE